MGTSKNIFNRCAWFNFRSDFFCFCHFLFYNFNAGNEGCVLIKGCSKTDHKAFEIKLFESPNGASDNSNDFPIRIVLSSVYWGGSDQQLQGIPDGKSDCAFCTTNCQGCQSVNYTAAFDPSSTGYDETYTRVHRDPDIVKAMRKWLVFELRKKLECVCV